jgi:pimeloyl-ACP methyl ester carboxylesterase
MTEAGRRSASLGSNRSMLGRFLREVVGEPAILVGNSMGGLLSLLEAGREPELVTGLVLVNPALPRGSGARIDPIVVALFASLMAPGFGAMMLKRRAVALGPEGLVKTTLALCCRDPRTVSPEIVAAHVEQARRRVGMKGAERAYLQAARSLVGYMARRGPFERTVRSIDLPALLIHGRYDRLVPVASARALAQLRRDWSVEVMDQVGHVPQLEDPDGLLRRVESWLASVSDARLPQRRHPGRDHSGHRKQAADGGDPKRRSQSDEGAERAS